MPNREAYLRFLNQKGLREQDVLPMMTVDRRGAFLSKCLQWIAEGSLDDQASEFVIKTLENIDANANHVLEKIHSELRDTLKASGVSVPTQVFAGVFPTSEFNAHATQLDDGYLILVDNGCFQLIEGATSILLSDWEIEKKAQLLARIVQLYCRFDKIPIDEEYDDTFASQSKYAIAVGIINFAEEFTVAHEYGHITNEHFSTEPGKDRELEADLWALQAIVKGEASTCDSGESTTILKIAGVLTFLGLAHLIERYNAKSDTNKQSSDRVYPLAIERILQAYFYLVIKGLDDKLFLGRRFLDLVDKCCQVLLKEPLGIEFGALDILANLFPYAFSGSSDTGGSELELLSKMVNAAQEAGILSSSQAHSENNSLKAVEEGWFGEPMPQGMSKAQQSNSYIWDTGRGIKVEMKYVPPGEFEMGPDDWTQAATSTTCKVNSGYYMARFPVTWSEYGVFCRATGHELPEAPEWGIVLDHPVVNVSWNDAVAFCRWSGLSLPSEHEWEKAARGTDGRIYPWGNERPTERHCISAESREYGHKSTAPVPALPDSASPYGIEQMSGNVWEWCEDWFDYGDNVSMAGQYRVLRGGSFRRSEESCRTISRHRASPTFKFYEIGFRPIKRNDEHIEEETSLDILTSIFARNAEQESKVNEAPIVDESVAGLLFSAVSEWDIVRIREILKSVPEAVHARDNQGHTPLHRAASLPYLEQSYEIGRTLIEYGADVNARDKDGATPLHYVACRAQWFGLSFAELLLSRGADGSIRDKTGETPVHVAKRWAHVYGDSILHMLSRYGFR